MKSRKEKKFFSLENTDEIKEKEEKEITEEPVKRRVPLFSKILLVIAAVCLVLYILLRNIPSLADFFNKYISPVIRAVLSYATTWIPFSLAETLIILLPVIIIAVVSVGIKKYSDTDDSNEENNLNEREEIINDNH